MSDRSSEAVAVECLASASRALLTCHTRPDGDAVGSELALAELAGALGTATEIYNRDPAPAGFGELPGAGTIRVVDEVPSEVLERVDLVVALECPTLERSGFRDLDRLPVLNIDHHAGNTRHGAVSYVDEQAPAAGEMVWRMFSIAGIEPSADAANCALVALTTDTGDFRYSNATPRAFRAAADMVAAGASTELVAEWVHQRKSEASVRLLGRALETLSLHADGRVAVISVDPDAFHSAGAGPADTDDLIDVPRAIAGVEVTVFLKQWTSGEVRVSLRSKRDIDVRAVAVGLGGGGHRNAAGCTVEGDVPGARNLVLARVLEQLGGER